MSKFNKTYSGLTGLCFKMPNAPYSSRYGQGKERHRTMEEILLANRKVKGNATAQAYTFAIRTSQHTDQKLQKSMLLANAPKKTDND